MLKFGDKIQFDVRYVREKHWLGKGEGRQPERWHIWHPNTVPTATGIIIGRRTLHDGISWDESGYSFLFMPKSNNTPGLMAKENIPVYLVAINMIDSPIYIPIIGYNQEQRS